MFTAKQFRLKAAEFAESLKHTDVPSEIRRLERAKDSFAALAENEDWLATNFDKIIHSQSTPPADGGTGTPVTHVPDAEAEERVLRCLGAAVIMQWKHNPDEATARALRYRGFGRRCVEVIRTESANCSFSAQAKRRREFCRVFPNKSNERTT